MEILKEIRERRSIRKFKDRDVMEEQVRLLIEAASMAPSGHNTQPWRFLIVRDEETKAKIAKADHEQDWMTTVPVLIACVADSTLRDDGDMIRVIRDTSIAGENLLLQAQHLGLGSCWTGWYEQEEMREVLGLPDTCFIVGVLAIGYADEAPEARPRKGFEEITK